jgi:PAS domain S-box-containing protein
VAIIRNISERQAALRERKRGEEELRQLNERLEEEVARRTAELETLFNTLPDYIFVVDRQGKRITFCNDIFAQGIGFAHRQQVQGKAISECFSDERVEYFAQQNQQVFSSGETLHLEETIILSSGIHHFDTYKVPLKDSQGEVYALLGASRDITELIKTQQALSERTVQLEVLNKELDSFSYSVSHDLRAPLRHVNGFVNALRQRLEINNALNDPKVTHYLQVIEDSSQKMGDLIDGLLTLSRLGRRELVFAPVDLQQLVENVINLLSSSLEIKQLSATEFRVGNLPQVKGDMTLLQQVFTNLIGNAIKFSQGRLPATIEIDSQPDGTIFVKDNGVGFSPQYADQLFGAFQRLHSKQQFEGTGIGLSIVQRIIHRHGGQIWAESAPDEGATFYFTLGKQPLRIDEHGS